MSDRERLIEAMVKAMMNVVYAGEHRNANDPAYVPLDAQKLATAALDAALPILVEVSEEALLQGVDALYVDITTAASLIKDILIGRYHRNT